MTKIRRLSDELANQIAAGEVVERPASVVKELVENALDAGASRVVVEVEQGGTVMIRVTDDGEGMEREDALLCLERHATSKIGRFEDLAALGTFGFRGEALPSIASVSRLRLRSRPRSGTSGEGVQVVVTSGGPPEVTPSGGAVGTTVEVNDLFFNVPARRKFLKATATESAHVGDVVLGAALARPDVTFVLTRDGRPVREYLRASSREERARAALTGEELASCLGERGLFRVEAMLAPPERARAGATGLSILVNGRPVRDRMLGRAVAQAYGSVLESGRYPVGVVWVDVPPEAVDVNVHPQKAEVRFADGRALFEGLTRELHASLARSFGLPALGPNPYAHRMGPKPLALLDPRPAERYPASFGERAPGDSRASASFGGASFGGEGAARTSEGAFGQHAVAPSPEALPVTTAAASGGAAPPGPDSALEPLVLLPRDASLPVAPQQNLFAASTPAARSTYASLRFVGQTHRMYLVCEGPDALYILDQHAAAERVTFARLRQAYEARAVPMQRLLVAELVELAGTEVALLDEHAAELPTLGLEIRPVGETAIAVHAVPDILRRLEPARVVRDLVAELSRAAGRPFGGAVDLVLATMACHGSIRAGDAVSDDEARALLAALDEVEFAGHCPHGRPLVMRLPWGELERRVGR